MFKKSIVALLTSLIVFSSSNALAFKWGVRTKVTGYYVYAQGDAFVNVEVKENPDKCLEPAYLILDTKAANFKEIYATIVTAQVSGQTVTLNYDGCVGNYPKIIAVATPGVW